MEWHATGQVARERKQGHGTPSPGAHRHAPHLADHAVKPPLLTFDDGPSESTEAILDLLREHGIKAVFFVLGIRADQRPDLVKRAADEGHIVGNHGWDHILLTDCSDRDVLAKLRQTNEVIERITGSAPTLFRAPWLGADERVLELAQALGLTHVGVHVDTNDYDDRYDADYVAQAILRARPGEIVLMHDGNGADLASPINPSRPKTVEALSQALPLFAERWSEREDSPPRMARSLAASKVSPPTTIESVEASAFGGAPGRI